MPPYYFSLLVLPVLRKNEVLLNECALVTIDEGSARVRIIPLS
jgi:hypothetical protein